MSAQVIGNDTAITIGGMQGNFELNVRIPLLARNLLGSIHLLTTTTRLFADKCVSGIEPNRERLQELAEGTLAMATALNPFIGYDRAAAIVKEATASGRQLREVAREHGVEESVLEEALNLRVMAAGSSASLVGHAAPRRERGSGRAAPAARPAPRCGGRTPRRSSAPM